MVNGHMPRQAAAAATVSHTGITIALIACTCTICCHKGAT
jgi:hypothetical protein